MDTTRWQPAPEPRWEIEHGGRCLRKRRTEGTAKLPPRRGRSARESGVVRYAPKHAQSTRFKPEANGIELRLPRRRPEDVVWRSAPRRGALAGVPPPTI